MITKGEHLVQVLKIRYIRSNTFRFYLHKRYSVTDLQDFLTTLGMNFLRVSRVGISYKKTNRRNVRVKNYDTGIKVFEVTFIEANFGKDYSQLN